MSMNIQEKEVKIMKHCVLNWQIRNSTYTFTGILLKRFNTVVFVSDEQIPSLAALNIEKDFEQSESMKNLKYKFMLKKVEKRYGKLDVMIIVGKNIKQIIDTEKFLDDNYDLLGDIPDDLNGTVISSNAENRTIFGW